MFVKGKRKGPNLIKPIKPSGGLALLTGLTPNHSNHKLAELAEQSYCYLKIPNTIKVWPLLTDLNILVNLLTFAD